MRREDRHERLFQAVHAPIPLPPRHRNRTPDLLDRLARLSPLIGLSRLDLLDLLDPVALLGPMALGLILALPHWVS
jgi:hypothetical protein